MSGRLVNPLDVPAIEEPQPHLLRLYVDGEDIGYHIDCPYAKDDPTRPCRTFGDYFDTDPPQQLVEGCGVLDYLNGGGYEAVAIPVIIEAAPVPVAVEWDNDYPALARWEDTPAEVVQ